MAMMAVETMTETMIEIETETETETETARTVGTLRRVIEMPATPWSRTAGQRRLLEAVLRVTQLPLRPTVIAFTAVTAAYGSRGTETEIGTGTGLQQPRGGTAMTALAAPEPMIAVTAPTRRRKPMGAALAEPPDGGATRFPPQRL